MIKDKSANNKRIAKNTAYLYVRMLITMFVSLYTSRVTLQVLGVTDFGIYNVVGGVVIMLGFFQSSLSNAAQRYLSLSLGSGDIIAAEKAFRQSFTIMLLFAFITLFIGETIGLWFVCEKLVIPVERMRAALWIYQFSLIAIFFSLIQVPLIADVVSRERMSIYAYLGLFEAFAKLGIAYILLITACDKLIVYGFLMALLPLIVFGIYTLYCKRYFPEAKQKWLWEKDLVKEMSAFIGYNLFGCFAYSGAEQGISIVLNLFFGPALNAARAISSQVVHIVTQFTTNLLTAFKPQIIKAYSARDKEYMFLLIEKSSRFSFFLAAVIAFPLIANMKCLLQIWLGVVPDYTSSFTILVMFEAIIGTLYGPLWIVANATGDIRNIQVYGRMITMLSLPLAYCSLLYYRNPEVAIFWLVVTQLLYWLFCVYDIWKQVSLNVVRYFRNVVIPCIIVLVSLSLFSFIPFTSFFPVKYHVDLFMSLSANLLFGIIIIAIILDRSEKRIAFSYINKILMIHKI